MTPRTAQLHPGHLAGRLWLDQAPARRRHRRRGRSHPRHGPDPAAMLAYARRVGGPALRALTFTQRAAILKALAKHLTGHVEEFAELSTRTGATRRDTAVDVDGGIGTLAVYASKAAASCRTHRPARRRDRVPEQRRHVRRPPRANAPSRRRSADQRLQLPGLGHAGEVRARVPGRNAVRGQTGRSDRLPDRAGRTSDHRVRAAARRSAVAALRRPRPGSWTHSPHRTPSASRVRRPPRSRCAPTRRRRPSSRSTPRRTPSTARSSARTSTPDDPEFTLFVDQLVTEMTVKAGQKCTAIRRAFVPATWSRPCPKPWPTAGPDRRRSPRPGGHRHGPGGRPGSASRSPCGGSPGCCPKPRRSSATRSGSRWPGPIPNAAPSCLRCCCAATTFPPPLRTRWRRSARSAPCCPTRDLDEVIDAAARGGGSLVGSIVTADPTVARTLVTALAPWHGRLLS